MAENWPCFCPGDGDKVPRVIVGVAVGVTPRPPLLLERMMLEGEMFAAPAFGGGEKRVLVSSLGLTVAKGVDIATNPLPPPSTLLLVLLGVWPPLTLAVAACSSVVWSLFTNSAKTGISNHTVKEKIERIGGVGG